jgi:cyclopropane-fatty-acyl-phospholipid synthase (EC 2.1.1.79)
MDAVEHTGLVATDVEIWRLHYAYTLRHWYDRFMARRDEAAALYDERFVRMWKFYLVASEQTFRFAGQGVFQIQLARDQRSVPLTRDYLTPAAPDLTHPTPGERRACGARGGQPPHPRDIWRTR